MDSSTICLIVSPIVSFVVSALKKIPWVKNYPKVMAGIISAILGSVVAIKGGYGGISYSDIVQCILIQFAGAVATHEAVVNPIKENVGENATPSGPDDHISSI